MYATANAVAGDDYIDTGDDWTDHGDNDNGAGDNHVHPRDHADARDYTDDRDNDNQSADDNDSQSADDNTDPDPWSKWVVIQHVKFSLTTGLFWIPNVVRGRYGGNCQVGLPHLLG